MCACTHKGGRPEFKFDIDKKNIKDAKSECHAKDEMLGDDYKCELYYERF